MWAVLLLVLTTAAIICNPSDNDDDLINPSCNYAGACGRFQCYCCDVTADRDFCSGNVPGKWSGDTCTKATHFTQVSWGYTIEGNDVTCANDGSPASPDFLNATISVMSDSYKGEILPMSCEVCTPESPCSFFEPEATSGIFVKFASDINTFYDEACSHGDLPASIRACASNYDNGASGFLAVKSALDEENNFLKLRTDLPTYHISDTFSWSSNSLNEIWQREVTVSESTIQTSRLPTPFPTSKPTSTPTPAPNESPCGKYISDSNFDFLGVGSSCRGNIIESSRGGRTCESPYIICLPYENTPSNDIMGEPYKSGTYRYSVSECLQECSYDQRCMGIEFVADENSALGDCNLLDDIPIAPVNEVDGYTYNENDVRLDKVETGGDALCWEKTNYCNPYFEAEDLNDIMLNCYCPNNRKGSYTKKVKRTVSNTRYCNNDALVEKRIKKAQANRMFHLCENWCLFDTINPNKERWYWDPWKTCWRETYSGTGEHLSYCDRVIRNPDSIELKFVNHRSDNFLKCGASEHPTSAPVADISSWILGDLDESCDMACTNIGKVCAEDHTAKIFESVAALTNAFAEAGHTCNMNGIEMNNALFYGWALPGLRDSKDCVNRLPTLSHLKTLDTDCSRKLGSDWQRLCACY